MPQAIKADRPLIQALFAQGFAPYQIEAKTGVKAKTICTWATRYGWRKAAADAKELVKRQTMTVTAPAISRTVAGLSDRVRETLGVELEKQVATLSLTPTKKGLNGLARKASVTKLLVDAARPVFGWDDQHSTSAVSVEAMMDLAHRQAELPSVTVLPALDSPADTSATRPCIEAQAEDDMATDPSI